jgi:hypothetical protein
MSENSRIRDNNMYGTVANFLKDKIQDGASLSFVSAYFTINAFNALRDSSDDFNPYSKQFVHEFRNQIENIFAIRVDKIEKDVEYTEIFDFCRSVLIKQSPTVYARAFVLLSRHESAKIMMSISFLAALGFLVRGTHLWLLSESIKWSFTILTGVGFLLVFLFFYMYKRLLKYYRNTVIYGFYEYAVTRKNSEESENSEN